MSATNSRNGSRRNDAPTNGAAHGEYRAAVPSVQTGEDTSHAGLMAALDDAKRTASLMAKVTYMARTRYGIRVQDAHDIFNDAVATYLVVHMRYPAEDNHFGLLVGIFHRKSLEFLGASKRANRVAERLVRKLRADRPTLARGEDPEGDVSDRVIRDEDATLIRHAVESLTPEGRDLLLALAEGRATRLEMIRSLGINRNTFDTRLRALRLRLLKTLRTPGAV